MTTSAPQATSRLPHGSSRLPYATTRRQGSFRSVADMWNHRVGSTPDLVAMIHRVDGVWTSMLWRQADQRVRAIAAGLIARGVGAEDRVAILADTSVGWILADMGIMAAGGATTTIYPSETSDACAFILADSGSMWVFCDTVAQVHKVVAHRDHLPALRGVISLLGEGSDDGFVTTVATLEREGQERLDAEPGLLQTVQAAITPEHLATLIYTSGTTGQPKGVELTHDAWVYEAEAIDQLGQVGPDDQQFLFLPLAHVFAKVMQVAFIRLGVPTAVDGSVERFLDNVAEVRPTWMAAVPRVFEKAYNRIVADARDRGPVAWTVFRAALKVGREVSRRRRAGRAVPARLLLPYAVADRMVFARVREAFGGRLRFLVSGGAPLPVEIAEFFDACGILICEGYGLTESAAASCVNTPDDVVFGTVGRPLPGCEVRIASDGEILLRSRGVMRGYHDNAEATAEVLDADGWLHTGDIGRVLPTGHVQITDRKKDILVTAGGKNVAPAHFQNLLKARSPYVAHALMVGDRRNFCAALISVDPEAIARWASAEGIEASTTADLIRLGAVRELVQQAVDDVNRELPGYEKVRKVALVAEPFTVESGELTPTLKMKRRAIETRYADLIDSFYDGAVARL